MRAIIALTLMGVVTGTCSAGIQEWNSHVQGTDWDVTNGNEIIILASGTFKFQSVTAGSLDEIGMITIADSVTGTVTVHIARNPADSAGVNGATNVGLIDLTNSNITPVVGNLAELRISGNLGDDGPSVVRSITGPLVLDDIVDDLTVNTDIASNGSITAGDIRALSSSPKTCKAI